MSHEVFQALVVAPDPRARLLLKQAASSVYQFGDLTLSPSLGEALARLEHSELQIIFISSEFENCQTASFITLAKATIGGRDTAYVLVLKPKDQGSLNITRSMLQGADGFLCEPYSVDALLQITELAAKVKQERTAAREKAALTFLVGEIMTQLDLVASLKKARYEANLSQRSLREMCSTLGDLKGEALERYYEVCVTLFSEASPPTLQVPYGGASHRVRQKQEAKLLAEIKSRAAAGGR